jgi:hypothetical protein
VETVSTDSGDGQDVFIEFDLIHRLYILFNLNLKCNLNLVY